MYWKYWEIKIAGKNDCKNKFSSCILYIVLFSIFFAINIGIGAYFVHSHWYLKKFVSRVEIKLQYLIYLFIHLFIYSFTYYIYFLLLFSEAILIISELKLCFFCCFKFVEFFLCLKILWNICWVTYYLQFHAEWNIFLFTTFHQNFGGLFHYLANNTPYFMACFPCSYNSQTNDDCFLNELLWLRYPSLNNVFLRP